MDSKPLYHRGSLLEHSFYALTTQMFLSFCARRQAVQHFPPEQKSKVVNVKQKPSWCWCFAPTYTTECLLSADNSQAVTQVGPQMVLDRFITTNTAGQSQVIHQGAELIQQSRVKSKISLCDFFCCSVYVEVTTSLRQFMAFFFLVCSSMCIIRAALYAGHTQINKICDTLTLKGFFCVNT